MRQSSAMRLEAAAPRADTPPFRVVAGGKAAAGTPSPTDEVARLLEMISDAAHHILESRENVERAMAESAAWEARCRKAEDLVRETENRLRNAESRASQAEGRVEELERHLRRAGFAVVEAESRLTRALDQGRAERERAAAVQRSSAAAVERMRTLLNQTGDRLRQATTR